MSLAAKLTPMPRTLRPVTSGMMSFPVLWIKKSTAATVTSALRLLRIIGASWSSSLLSVFDDESTRRAPTRSAKR